MSQKSSVPQAVSFVSQVLKRDSRYSRRADCQRNFWRKGSIIKQPVHRMAQNNKKQMQIITTHPDADGLASSRSEASRKPGPGLAAYDLIRIPKLLDLPP